MKKKFIFYIFAFVMFAIVFEGIFYTYYKFIAEDDKKLKLYDEKKIGSLSYSYNKEYGLVLPKPNVTITSYNSEFTDRFITKDIFNNGIGFFDDGIDEKKYKAVAIGDSFTRGVGSIDNLKNGWVELVEKNLDNIDILPLANNIGIITQKYSYDKLKNLIDHNVVIYNFFSGGDFIDNTHDISYDYYFSQNLNKFSVNELQNIVNELNIKHHYKHHLEYLNNNKIKSYTLYFMLKVIDLANVKGIVNTYKFDFNIPISELRLNVVSDELFNFKNNFKEKNRKFICNEINCYDENSLFNENDKKTKLIKNSADQINHFYEEIIATDKKFILIMHPYARNFYPQNTNVNYNDLDQELLSLLNEKIKIIYLKEELDKEFNNSYKNIFYKYDGHYNLFGYKLVSEIIAEKLKEYLK